ncbi:MAG: hypothetical protein A3F35_02255 [Candidatus Woykebacteria bacterium RIFCSPHIGHO2_12_FULL_45_10]|uniref:Uncharacterized protein n=1 Tax=Candidatus Woykebacteria bacterium RIFCSPHIGHO2_12_FULL_45_10 TaxID=1802603 RepID=A0A1G1WQ48_9BACT|nr:MAG: hypothetical protein A3F35_02255 [Candidatus Woykebacteria bacterium RIFCSPHIGHO2_12_FULL_45_10]
MKVGRTRGLEGTKVPITHELPQNFVGGQLLIDAQAGKGIPETILRGEISSVKLNQATRILKVTFVWLARLVPPKRAPELGRYIFAENNPFVLEMKNQVATEHEGGKYLTIRYSTGVIEFSVRGASANLDPSHVFSAR